MREELISEGRRPEYLRVTLGQWKNFPPSTGSSTSRAVNTFTKHQNHTFYRPDAPKNFEPGRIGLSGDWISSCGWTMPKSPARPRPRGISRSCPGHGRWGNPKERTTTSSTTSRVTWMWSPAVFDGLMPVGNDPMSCAARLQKLPREEYQL